MDPEDKRVDSMEPDKAIVPISKYIPLEFYYVKALFLQSHYRQCISTCRQILNSNSTLDGETEHPLKQAYAQYYFALAHDELARTMHNFSQAKIPAFSQAESFYQEVLAAMPTADECRRVLEKQHFEEQVNVLLPESTSDSTLNSDVFRRPPSPSPVLSPPSTRFSTVQEFESPSMRTSSDFDDLESHDSFDNEVVTPNRMPRLPSTFSSMSLLEPPKQAHGLMRPVRPGSIAKPYQVPLKLSPSGDQRRSRLPRLATSTSLGSPVRQSSPVRKQLRTSDEEWSPIGSPISPVSPLGSSYADSDDVTISPISPSTPVTAQPDSTFDFTPAKSMVDALDEHIRAFSEHIAAQLELLQEVKQRTLQSQAERMTKNNSRAAPAAKQSTLSARGEMAQSRSYWLFTSDDMKIAEKQKRIQEGRDRLWARKRFDPSRYRQLAEKALAEL